MAHDRHIESTQDDSLKIKKKKKKKTWKEDDENENENVNEADRKSRSKKSFVNREKFFVVVVVVVVVVCFFCCFVCHLTGKTNSSFWPSLRTRKSHTNSDSTGRGGEWFDLAPWQNTLTLHLVSSWPLIKEDIFVFSALFFCSVYRCLIMSTFWP